MPENPEHPFDQEHGARDETVLVLARGQKVFNRYRLTRILGRGGMGVVWLAKDEDLDRDVALKFLPESICHDKEAAAELKRETKRSLELTHPNIVRIYDFVHDDDRAAIAMEYIDGWTLSAKKVEMPARCFEVKDIAPFVQQLCAALDYAHAIGRVVHQDLKPANLMINSKGQLKVTDFGIARSIADSVTRITAEDTIGGTLVYMSPQQLNGERPSAANDIYSLGATIYDLLTGKPPFYTGSLHHQIEKNTAALMSDRRKESEIIGGEIPQVWEETIAACLAKKPEDRPSGAAEVARRLSLHGGSDASWMTKLPGRNAPNSHFQALSPKLLTAAALAVILVIGLVAFIVVDALKKHTDSPKGADGRPSHATNQSTSDQANVEWLSEPLFDDVNLPRVLPMQLADKTSDHPWENSIGMKFVPVGKVGFSIWETRLRDFATFVKATRHDSSGNVSILTGNGWISTTNDWQNPGFPQSELHPVTCVNWHDAAAFCRWLTQTERKNGLLKPNQRYRMPEKDEWMLASGDDGFVWGDDWPPKSVVANLAGTEVLADNWPSNRNIIADYTDDFRYTAPVGSFPANSLGIYDLAGNVWEWGFDWSDATKTMKTFRGGSWDTQNDNYLRKDFSHPMETIRRNTTSGFRCVLEQVTSK